MKEMAVLFTDIVGSSKYFKSHGDIEGRKMLRRHQDIASPAITEYGGVPVKFLGDSVMAYFLNPGEALRSAIRIQQSFQHHNRDKDPKAEIHVRICLHFGQGIVEENDIFGDVVNMAAKFLPYAAGDQIFVSDKIHDKVRDMPLLHFEEINISDKKDVLNGLNIYRVFWDEGMNLEPVLQTLLYFKPLTKLGKNKFPEAWNHFLKVRKTLWGNEVLKESLFSDKSVALIIKKAPAALDIALSLKNFLKVNLGQEGALFIPVQIIIDSGPYLMADRLVLNDFKVNWEAVDPGDIYISGAVCERIKKKGVQISSTPESQQPRPFYKLREDGGPKSENHLFLYQNALVRGENAPCYYCGDRRHLAGDCPSKQLTELTSFINHLGYLSLEEINNLFFKYLNGPMSQVQPGGGDIDPSSQNMQMAHHAFFELKSVYQLRFLRAVWSHRAEDWSKIKELKDDSEKGGLLWIGQDCIRVSNFEQAENILSDYLEKNPEDYRAYCSLGFLNIERGQLLLAKQYLSKAREHTKTTPQKVFILFLLSRLHELDGDPMRAEQKISEILRLSPYCSEALYRDILFKFRKGKGAVALHQLIKLIKTNRDLYIYALIDPDMAGFGEMVHPELKKVFYESKNEATRIIPEAEGSLELLKRFLGPAEKETKEAATLWSKIQEMSKTDSFFAYQDIIHYGNTLIQMGHHGLDRKRKKLSEIFFQLKKRHENCMIFTKQYPYPFFIDALREPLKNLLPGIEKGWDMADSKAPDTFKNALIRSRELSSTLDQIELKIKRLIRLQEVFYFSGKFFKKSLIFQSASLIIAIFLFPIITHYLNFLLPSANISLHNIWVYQKGVLILGSISAFFLAILSSSKGLSKK
ncbi:MAG: adenylate/guanylate cyclase domain-containing protein [Pseudomonadota bacterium]